MLCMLIYFPSLRLKTMVRQICALVSEYFHGFMSQLEAEPQHQRQEQQQQVKAKMLKRLSKPEPVKSEKSSRATSRKATEPSVGAQTAPLEVSLEQAFQTYAENVQAEIPSPKQKRLPHSHGEEDIAEEIGRHFMAVTKEPSHRQQRAQASRGPAVKRLSTEDSKGKKKDGRRESNDSITELLPPISVGKIAKHDGNIIAQKLEDTTGIKLREDISDYLVLKGKPRARINPAPSSQVVQMKVAKESQTKSSDSTPLRSKESRPESSDSNVLRTSLLLEKMEEGEKETRIDGDGKETILIQTTMGEKETAIVGSHGSAILLPTSELDKYQEEEKVEPVAPPTSSPPVLPPPPPPPPPKPEQPERKPWPGETTHL